MYGDASFIAHLVRTFCRQLLLENNTECHGGGLQIRKKELGGGNCLFKKSLSENENKANPPPSLGATFLYLLSPVDPGQNLAADVAVLSWL